MNLQTALLFMSIVLLFIAPFQQVFAWTYDDSSWWFGPSFDQLAGNLGITISYPDLINRGDDLEVAVTLEYIKNENAKSNYVVFSNVQVHLRDSLRSGQDIATSSENATSGIINPGNRYSHLFTISSSRLANVSGEYAVDLSFTALFSRSTSLEVYSWDSGIHYLEGIVSSEELQNIVLANESGQKSQALVIGIKRPYALLNPVLVTIDGKAYNIADSHKLKVLLENDTSHTISVPEELPLVSGIRAIFVSWADGYAENERNQTIQKNEEIFAIYKTQYLLNVTSELGAPKGQGWHDSGSNAAFSVDPLAGALALRGFDKWEGDFVGKEPIGTVMMDGPKTINASWKFETTFVAGIVGTMVGVVSLVKLLPPLIKKIRKRQAQ